MAEVLGDVLSVSEAARELGISVDTARAWADCGKLAVQRTGSGARIFTRVAIDRVKADRIAMLEQRSGGR